MTKQRKKILFTSILLFVISFYHEDYEYHADYEIISEEDDSLAYAKYRDGLIYIGDREFLSCIDCQKGDILIEDQRYSLLDPNMKIYSSYEIVDKESRNDIIEVIQEYEKKYPSTWNRTKDSMRLEWFLHNIFYDFGYQRNRTTNVDLDNEDEEVYSHKILQKIFKL